MKKIVFIFCLLVSLAARSQVNLGISPYTFTLYGDSVAANALDSADIWVINSGAATFNDTLNINIWCLDSAGGAFHPVDFIDAGIKNIPANDSVQLRIYQTMTISPATYHYDINVIVIWPSAFLAATSDSLTLPIYVYDASGVNELNLYDLIKAYPNPSSDHFQIANEGKMAIEEVRITDAQGKLIAVRAKETTIDTEHWKPGMYLVHIVLEDGRTLNLRILKSK
jgi:hypothetical protein